MAYSRKVVSVVDAMTDEIEWQNFKGASMCLSAGDGTNDSTGLQKSGLRFLVDVTVWRLRLLEWDDLSGPQRRRRDESFLGVGLVGSIALKF